MKNINPDIIVNINVLKGEKTINKKYDAAMSVNGVIEITTKENNLKPENPPYVIETGKEVSTENIILSKNDDSK